MNLIVQQRKKMKKNQLRKIGCGTKTMKDVGSDIGVKNIPDLVLKEIYCIFETKKPSKEQVNENKMTKRKIRKRKRQQEKEKFLRTIIPLKNILLVFIKLILIFINIMK